MIKDTLVLTPSLGTRHTLRNTINSVRNVSSERIHHVLVGPKAKLVPFKEEFPWIEILDDSFMDCKSIYAALNLGLHHFRDYKYFAYINDDDYWLPDFISLFSILDEADHLMFCSARNYFKVKISDSYHFIESSWLPYPSFFERYFSIGIPLFTQQALLLRRSALAFFGDRFNLDYPVSADSLLWSLITSRFKGRSLNKVVAVYDLTGERISTQAATIAIDSHALSNGVTRKYNKVYTFALLAIFRLFNLPLYLKRLLANQGSLRIST